MMETKVTVSDTGRLDAESNTWATRNRGFNGEVVGISGIKLPPIL